MNSNTFISSVLLVELNSHPAERRHLVNGSEVGNNLLSVVFTEATSHTAVHTGSENSHFLRDKKTSLWLTAA